MSPALVTTLVGALGAVALVAALYAVTSRYVLRSVLAFGAVFFLLGLVYMALGFTFVGLGQILLYVGGVAVLVVFAFVSALSVREAEAGMAPSAGVGAIAAALTTALLSAAFYGLTRSLPSSIEPVHDGSAVAIGTLFLTKYLLGFELMSILLVAALVAALALVRHGRRERAAEAPVSYVPAVLSAPPKRPRKRPMGRGRRRAPKAARERSEPPAGEAEERSGKPDEQSGEATAAPRRKRASGGARRGGGRRTKGEGS